MEEIVQAGLEGNEHVSLLSWVMNTYPGSEMMLHADLRVDLSKIGPVLSPERLNKLESEYLRVSTTFIHHSDLLLTLVLVHTEHGQKLRGMDDKNSRNREARLVRRHYARL